MNKEHLKYYPDYERPPVRQLPRERWVKLNLNTKGRYLISDKGRLYSFRSGRLITGKMCEGYRIFEYTPQDDNTPLRADGKKRTQSNGRIGITFGQLVAMHFLNKPKGNRLNVLHLDYNKQNDAVSNLRYVELTEVMSHTVNSPRFSGSPGNGRLSAPQVKEIRKELKRPGATLRSIAYRYNVSDMTISRIRHNQSWSNIK